jgi:hypothetical protein
MNDSTRRTLPGSRCFGTLMIIALLTAGAGTSFAGDAPGQASGTSSTNDSGNRLRQSDRLGGPVLTPEDEHTVAPVPEPGTMALASMGLVALGAGLRKRRDARRAGSAGKTTD